MKKSTAALLLLLYLAAGAQAHPGHHHENGLPDFPAHMLLGLEYLAGSIAVTACAFLLRHAFKGKSQKTDLPADNP